MVQRRGNILLLCAAAARHIGTVEAHISAFGDYSQYHVVTLDSAVAGELDFDLSIFDCIVMHYSIVISLPQYVSDKLAQRIRAFDGLKILFVQDEFRWVNRTSHAAEELGITVLFTVVNKDVIQKIYHHNYFDSVRFEQTLTGFIPEELVTRDVPQYEDRTLDIGYRARKLPGWCGEFAQQKWQIGEKILDSARTHRLKCDISMSESSRLYGEDWVNFLSSCRATLGSESGASFVDYTGLVHQEIDAYEAAHPEASFEEIRERFLEGRDGETIIHVISPRVFEAAALRVLMILYPGAYSDVLQAGRHYLELKFDHSNLDEIIQILRTPARAQEVIENAYQEIACSQKWTHRAFIENFDRIVDEELEKYAEYTGAQRWDVDEQSTDKFEKLKWLDKIETMGKQEGPKKRRFGFLPKEVRLVMSALANRGLSGVGSTLLFGVGRRIVGLIRAMWKA